MNDIPKAPDISEKINSPVLPPEEPTFYQELDDELTRSAIAALREGSQEHLRGIVEGLEIHARADFLQKLPGEEREILMAALPDLFPAEVYTYLDPEVRRETLSAIPAAKVAAIVADLESDDALDLILNLNPELQQDVIRNLSATTRIVLQEGLSFPEDSAGRLMQREYVAIPQFWTVGKTLDYLRAAGEDLPPDFYDLIVIDPGHHVVGEIPLHKLLRIRRSEKIQDLTENNPHIIPATMDQEEVAHIFRREGIGSAPVVDQDNRLIGVITYDDVIDVIDEEAQEDILKLAGVEEGDLYRAVIDTSGSRFRWLFVNLLTAVLASIVISFFDATIEQIVALAVLMPIVASMGGNAGTQALTVAVRALATKELTEANMMRVIWKETLVGTLNGVGFAFIAGIIAALWFSNATLGVVIGVAMIINLIAAGLFGAGIPIVLHKVGSDPALSSTVFLTTVTDVVGFLAFLGLASVFLL